MISYKLRCFQCWTAAGLYAFLASLLGTVVLAEGNREDAQASCPLLVSPEDLKANWHSYSGGAPGPGWEITNGEMHLRKGKLAPQGGNLLSVKEYRDFELSFEFKNDIKGNSGVKYRVAKYGDSWLGFEYQIYDEASFENVPDRGVTGAIYDLYEPITDRPLNPPGEWNRAKVVVQGNRIEHWLNEVLIAKAVIGNDDWDKRYSQSKFNDTPGFGCVSAGKLMITDHGSEIWLRNMSIRELNPSTDDSEER